MNTWIKHINIFTGQNTLDLPPEIDKGETGIFQSDPSKTLAAYQRDLEESGQIDLGRKVEVTAEELEVFSMLLLSLNRKKCPLKTLILDNCDLTDEKLVGLIQYGVIYKLTISIWNIFYPSLPA